MAKCKKQAQFIVPWANQTYIYCEKHANEIILLGQAIGANVVPRAVLTADICEQTEED